MRHVKGSEHGTRREEVTRARDETVDETFAARANRRRDRERGRELSHRTGSCLRSRQEGLTPNPCPAKKAPGDTTSTLSPCESTLNLLVGEDKEILHVSLHFLTLLVSRQACIGSIRKADQLTPLRELRGRPHTRRSFRCYDIARALQAQSWEKLALPLSSRARLRNGFANEQTQHACKQR